MKLLRTQIQRRDDIFLKYKNCLKESAVWDCLFKYNYLSQIGVNILKQELNTLDKHKLYLVCENLLLSKNDDTGILINKLWNYYQTNKDEITNDIISKIRENIQKLNPELKALEYKKLTTNLDLLNYELNQNNTITTLK